MRVPFIALLLAAPIFSVAPKSCPSAELVPGDNSLQKVIDSYTTGLKNTLQAFGRQIMLQSFDIEERTRSDGDSGLKNIRLQTIGSRPYFAETHAGRSFAAIHDHSNNIRTIGMGETVAVLNGIEFRTRHNDFGLRMPSTTSSAYHAVEDVPFPDVPQEVTSKSNIQDQILEMREWFRAFKNQDHSVRDYRQYFKPIICYLEGAWIKINGDEIEEPFLSDRHFVDAVNQLDLNEKNFFGAYTGRKSQDENWTYLPIKLFELKTEGKLLPIPVFGQFNYRILCSPLKDDLPLDRLRLVDDIASRMRFKKTYDEHRLTRAARFQLAASLDSSWDEERPYRYGLLDELMYQVPGKDNFLGNITDNVANNIAQHFATSIPTELNGAFYNRAFKIKYRDAMGQFFRTRGFNDANLFTALNTQDKVLGRRARVCDIHRKNCKYEEQKTSYAIPLEIIYLTPLSKWNPHNITYKGDPRSDLGKTVWAGGRYGAQNKEKAYDGSNAKVYYRTPVAFFADFEKNRDLADTTKNAVGVLDSDGNVQLTQASGIRITIPYIPGVGTVRQRYPIAPLYAEGTTAMKTTEALQDVIMEQTKYLGMLRETPTYGIVQQEEDNTVYSALSLRLRDSATSGIERHHHDILISATDVKEMHANKKAVAVDTTHNVRHRHTLLIRYIGGGRYRYYTCDGMPDMCKDKHPYDLIVTKK